MTSDQDRTIDALTLFHGGWAKVETTPFSGTAFVTVAGDHPGYSVFPDGDVLDRSREINLTADEVQLAVYQGGQ